jgi:hypothetical protein
MTNIGFRDDPLQHYRRVRRRTLELSGLVLVGLAFLCLYAVLAEELISWQTIEVAAALMAAGPAFFLADWLTGWPQREASRHGLSDQDAGTLDQWAAGRGMETAVELFQLYCGELTYGNVYELIDELDRSRNAASSRVEPLEGLPLLRDFRQSPNKAKAQSVASHQSQAPAQD